MYTVKICPKGNSLSIVLPKDLEGLGYTAGKKVLLVPENGELRVVLEERVLDGLALSTADAC